ncbi:MAG: hypothetical protein QMD73_08520 [Rhodocyclaceae bacterium]|nr:hypothetical protein [Rhodocyclaceae bacterium]
MADGKGYWRQGILARGLLSVVGIALLVGVIAPCWRARRSTRACMMKP